MYSEFVRPSSVFRLVFLLCCLPLLLFSQKKSVSHGTGETEGPQAVLTYSVQTGEKASAGLYRLFILGKRSHLKCVSANSREERYTDFGQMAFIRTSRFKTGKFSLVRSFENLKSTVETKDSLRILGHLCKGYLSMDRADTLESWIWHDTELKGSPVDVLIPGQGVVLAIDRNGKREWELKKLEFRKVRTQELDWPALKGHLIGEQEYNRLGSSDPHLEIPVFRQEIIAPVNLQSASFDHFTRAEHYAGGTLIVRRIKIPDIERGSRIFLKLSNWSKGDPTPAPASVFLIPQGRKRNLLSALNETHKSRPAPNSQAMQTFRLSEKYEPPLELMRFTTSYGFGFYDTEGEPLRHGDSLAYVQDITDLKQVLTGEIVAAVYMAGTDHRGNLIDLDLEIYHNPAIPHFKSRKQFVKPLVFTVNPLKNLGKRDDRVLAEDSIEVDFKLVKPLVNARLRLISGSFSGADSGDPISFQANEIEFDDEPLARIIPLRTDCGNFRNKNPLAGIDANGNHESDRSHAGWCPGSVSHPVYLSLGELEAGDHHLRVSVGKGGGTEARAQPWQLSLTLLGEYAN